MIARLNARVSRDETFAIAVVLLIAIVVLSTPSAVAYANDIRFLDPASSLY